MQIPIIDYLVRTILVSILEQGFIFLAALRIFGKVEDAIKSKKKFIAFIVTSAMLSNLPRLLNINQNIGMILGIVTVATLLSIFLGKMNYMVVIATLGAFAVFTATELLVTSIVMHAAHLAYDSLQKDALIAFLATLPERMIQYVLLYFFIFKCIKKSHANKCTVDVFCIIRSTKSHRRNFFVIFLFYTAYVVVLCKILIFDEILFGLSEIYALSIIVLLFSIPCVSLYIMIESIYRSYADKTEYHRMQSMQIKAKAHKALIAAAKSNDKDAVKAIEEVLASLDYQDNDQT